MSCVVYVSRCFEIGNLAFFSCNCCFVAVILMDERKRCKVAKSLGVRVEWNDVLYFKQ